MVVACLGQLDFAHVSAGQDTRFTNKPARQHRPTRLRRGALSRCAALWPVRRDTLTCRLVSQWTNIPTFGTSEARRWPRLRLVDGRRPIGMGIVIEHDLRWRRPCDPQESCSPLCDDQGGAGGRASPVQTGTSTAATARAKKSARLRDLAVDDPSHKRRMRWCRMRRASSSRRVPRRPDFEAIEHRHRQHAQHCHQQRRRRVLRILVHGASWASPALAVRRLRQPPASAL